MERLLHYVWQHKLFPLSPLMTTSGEPLEVIDPGLHNSDAGPDFFNAKIKVNGELWVGNVEVHGVSTDWYRHHHDTDEVYNNVVLHVVGRDEGPVKTQDGRTLPQVVVSVPPFVEEHYAELLREERFPPCYRQVPDLSPLLVESWLSALGIERLERKTKQINERAERAGGDWEAALFVTLARSFGFGINGDAFEEWADLMPLHAAGKHRDNLLQMEALFLGQAGLLEDAMLPSIHREEAMKDGYFLKLQNEYRFLAHKFTLQPMNGTHWRFLRLRPQNFPHIRIIQLVNLYYGHRFSISQIMEAETLDAVRLMLTTGVTPYWQTHYSFGAESAKSNKTLQKSSLDLLIINCVVPILFAYGRHRFHEEYCQRALTFLSELKAENNRFTRIWEETGLAVHTAADSQALIQLRVEYCQRKDCLRCRFGYEYLRNTKTYQPQ